MTVSGIPASPSLISTLRPEHREGAVRGQSPAPTNAPPASSPNALTGVRGSPRVPGAIPVTAPAGTDPELWSILTSAERDFFARSAAQGPLTYSKLSAAQHSAPASAPTARGGRVDVRV